MQRAISGRFLQEESDSPYWRIPHTGNWFFNQFRTRGGIQAAHQSLRLYDRKEISKSLLREDQSFLAEEGNSGAERRTISMAIEEEKTKGWTDGRADEGGKERRCELAIIETSRPGIRVQGIHVGIRADKSGAYTLLRARVRITCGPQMVRAR